MTPEEALTLTRIVKAAFPAQRFDEFTIDVWADALRLEEFGECRAAVTRLVTKQTFASVAEIIGEARTYRREAHREISSRRVLREIEAARGSIDPTAASRAAAEAREAFAKAIEDARRKRGEEDAVSA